MMRRQPKQTVLLMPTLFLTFSLFAAQDCPAQTETQDKAPPTHGAGDKKDAPENDIGLVSSEKGFRINATRKVMPEYPEEALKAGAQGVVVLSLYHDGEGNAAKIKVAESPHPALTRATITAVEQWKWRLFRSDDLYRPILSKLSFSFIIENGEGRVEDAPDEAGFASLKEVQPLRLKATWPDEASRAVNKGSQD